jgi:hypothetical protein
MVSSIPPSRKPTPPKAGNPATNKPPAQSPPPARTPQPTPVPSKPWIPAPEWAEGVWHTDTSGGNALLWVLTATGYITGNPPSSNR